MASRNLCVFLHRAEQWREGRRLLHQLMTGAEFKDHGRLAENANLQLLQAYLDEKEVWHVQNYCHAITTTHEIITSAPFQK